MALHPHGAVIVDDPGHPVRLTDNEAVPTARVGAQAVYIEALSDNYGTIYIGIATMDVATLDGVLATILPGQAWAYDSPAPAGFNVNELFMDADEAADGALVSSADQ